MEKIIGTVPGKCRKKREKARLTLNNNPEISWHMKKSRRTYNGVHLNKKSNTQDVVEQSLTSYIGTEEFYHLLFLSTRTVDTIQLLQQLHIHDSFLF